MAKKKQKDAPKDVKIKIIEKALDLAAERAWTNVTLNDIAKASSVSLAVLHEHFEDKSDIIGGLGRLVDKKVLEGYKADSSISPRDRLFELLMDRYDALNEYRDGLVSVLESFKSDPKDLVLCLPHLCKSMNWMLEAAGMDANGWAGALRLAGLTGLYVKNLRVWAKDESADLAKTMAALDRDLSRAESVANSIGL
jgi:ubiquinone biosynthesis protein COQ9